MAKQTILPSNCKGPCFPLLWYDTYASSHTYAQPQSILLPFSMLTPSPSIFIPLNLQFSKHLKRRATFSFRQDPIVALAGLKLFVDQSGCDCLCLPSAGTKGMVTIVSFFYHLKLVFTSNTFTASSILQFHLFLLIPTLSIS